MIVKKIEDVSLVPVEMDGAQGVSVRVLLGPKDSAPHFAMRQFEFAPKGHTPYHHHPFEHEVIIMEGDIALVSEAGEKAMSPGHVVLVPEDQVHQFRNISDSSPAKMICLVPIEYQP